MQQRYADVVLVMVHWRWGNDQMVIKLCVCGQGKGHMHITMKQTQKQHGTLSNTRTHTHSHTHSILSVQSELKPQQWTNTHSLAGLKREMKASLLLFFTGFTCFAAAVLPVRGRDGVNGRALLAGWMRGMGGVGQARSRLARIVVKLHQTEDQVRGHQLKLIRRVCDDISAHMEKWHACSRISSKREIKPLTCWFLRFRQCIKGGTLHLMLFKEVSS